MSEDTSGGFGQFVPGFDFLQKLARGAGSGMPQMPDLAAWVAPTLSVEELEKRIGELKTVHFWLDQNGKALLATIHALEVQKMTLATLQGMNLSMAELAKAMQLQPDAAAPAGARPADAPEPAQRTAEGAKAVDPLAWWGSLTQQFQEIATQAMQDVAEGSSAGLAKAAEAARAMGPDAAAPGPRAEGDPAGSGSATRGRGARAPAAQKSPARKSATPAPARSAGRKSASPSGSPPASRKRSA